jgi:hypothetical protein
MTRRRYTAESGRVRTMGGGLWTLARAEAHCQDLERIHARDEATGDTVNARQIGLCIIDLKTAIRDAWMQTARAA